MRVADGQLTAKNTSDTIGGWLGLGMAGLFCSGLCDRIHKVGHDRKYQS
jgi:hypothetical protein